MPTLPNCKVGRGGMGAIALPPTCTSPHSSSGSVLPLDLPLVQKGLAACFPRKIRCYEIASEDILKYYCLQFWASRLLIWCLWVCSCNKYFLLGDFLLLMFLDRLGSDSQPHMEMIAAHLTETKACWPPLLLVANTSLTWLQFRNGHQSYE